MSDGGGLDVVFDPAIDDGGWPGVLRERRAAVGEAWLGQAGLLGRLEGELGLGGPWLGPIERALALAPTLQDLDGWWSDSFDADRLGTCQRLLRDRDLLVAHGWRGEPVSERLDALWGATLGAPGGPADRVRAVAGALGTRGVDIARVRTASPLVTFDPGWRTLLARLAERGTRVEPFEMPEVRASGDLGRAQEALTNGGAFAPSGDGSLVLLRAHGPVAAADEVAALLADHAGGDGVVIVGADVVLDAALARHGLPRTGGAEEDPASAALVPLVIEAAFAPMDPADLHALLCLQPGPVPRGIASELVDALGDFPARGTEAWSKALSHGLERLDEDRRERVRSRLSALLDPDEARNGRLPVAKLERRLQALSGWARGRMGEVLLRAARGVCVRSWCGHRRADRVHVGSLPSVGRGC